VIFLGHARIDAKRLKIPIAQFDALATELFLFSMSAVSEFEINVKLLNEALVRLKPYYNRSRKDLSTDETILATIVELQALAIYVQKGSDSQSDVPPKDNQFDFQVWKRLKAIEDEATATDLAQNRFNKLFRMHQAGILKLATMNL
jgi:hypothetical protein